jgi:hypothetical protein
MATGAEVGTDVQDSGVRAAEPVRSWVVEDQLRDRDRPVAAPAEGGDDQRQRSDRLGAVAARRRGRRGRRGLLLRGRSRATASLMGNALDRVSCGQSEA